MGTTSLGMSDWRTKKCIVSQSLNPWFKGSKRMAMNIKIHVTIITIMINDTNIILNFIDCNGLQPHKCQTSHYTINMSTEFNDLNCYRHKIPPGICEITVSKSMTLAFASLIAHGFSGITYIQHILDTSIVQTNEYQTDMRKYNGSPIVEYDYKISCFVTVLSFNGSW